jgi:hypothetical protein
MKNHNLGLIFDENGNLKSLGKPFDKEKAYCVGLRTTKDCYQAPQITSI